jgi:hypothetical protein
MLDEWRDIIGECQRQLNLVANEAEDHGGMPEPAGVYRDGQSGLQRILDDLSRSKVHKMIPVARPASIK